MDYFNKKQCDIDTEMNGKKLCMLITPNTRVLDLSVVVRFYDCRQLLNLASVICPVRIMFFNSYCYLLNLYFFSSQELKTLVAGNLFSDADHNLANDFFYKFLPMFKHLKELDVYNCGKGFDDNSMEILGTHCQDLK